ncbi:MAG: alanine dehydrogenase [candidate division WOR-3 bacterium]
MKTLFINKDEVKELLTMEDTIKAVEQAFEAKGRKKAEMPCKVYLFYPKYNGDIRVMPSYLPELNISGVKVVNVHPDNPKKYRLPSVMATIVLINPKNGFPIAILDGTWITDMRTGAAGGVACKYLARKNSTVLALIGAGVQAETQLQAIVQVRPIKKVNVFDINERISKAFVKKQKKLFSSIEFYIAKSIKDCVADADIVSTQTPVRKPIVMKDWIKPGTHINAIGADAPGKQELDPELLRVSKIVIDDWEQASHSGEINVPLTKGIITQQDIYAEIGEVVAGLKKGRESDEEITIFDSTGLGIQDLTTAYRVYQIAKRQKIGTWCSLVSK